MRIFADDILPVHGMGMPTGKLFYMDFFSMKPTIYEVSPEVNAAHEYYTTKIINMPWNNRTCNIVAIDELKKARKALDILMRQHTVMI